METHLHIAEPHPVAIFKAAMDRNLAARRLFHPLKYNGEVLEGNTVSSRLKKRCVVILIKYTNTKAS